MTNSSPWYRWAIEIDGLPNLNMVIFHGYVKSPDGNWFKKNMPKKTHVQTCQKPMRRHQTFRHQNQFIETIWTRATLFGGAIFAWDHTSFAEAKVDTTPCTWARFTTAGTTYWRSWVGATFPPCGFVRTAGSNLRSNGFHGDKRRTWGYHRDIMGSQWWPGWWFQLCVSNHIFGMIFPTD